MGGRIADLDPDLRSLCLLAQRKAPEVKKAAEVAIVKLRSFDEENGSDADLGVFLKPISLSFSSMIPQLVSVALAAVQKLLATNRSSPVILTTIVRQLSMLTEIKDEGVQLRILQALALVHATTSVKEPSSDAEDPLVLAIRLCFQMLFFESNLIRNTAEATLRRIVSVFFERIGNAQESLGLQSAINLFKDFCKIVAGEQPTWLSVHETIGEALAADIIELLLEQNYDLVRKEEKFIEIIKVKVLPFFSFISVSFFL